MTGMAAVLEAAYHRQVDYLLRTEAVWREFFEVAPAKPLTRRQKFARAWRHKVGAVREAVGLWIAGYPSREDYRCG